MTQSLLFPPTSYILVFLSKVPDYHTISYNIINRRYLDIESYQIEIEIQLPVNHSFDKIDLLGDREIFNIDIKDLLGS